MESQTQKRKAKWKVKSVDAFLIFLQEVDFATEIQPGEAENPDWATVHQVDFEDLYKAMQSYFCPKDIDHFNWLLPLLSKIQMIQKGDKIVTQDFRSTR
jgi:hypothetical protein